MAVCAEESFRFNVVDGYTRTRCSEQDIWLIVSLNHVNLASLQRVILWLGRCLAFRAVQIVGFVQTMDEG